MSTQFPHVAMLITGAMHGVLGFVIFVISCVGLDKANDLFDFNHIYLDDFYRRDEGLKKAIDTYLGFVLVSSIWIMMVGVLGILTGIKRQQQQTTMHLKMGYMITSILSAALFTPSGIGFVAFSGTIGSFGSIGLGCSLCNVADFVLSIVSASICCCCANTTSNTTGTVFTQAPQGNYPPGTHLTINYPPGSYQPGTQPPGVYAPGAYPPGNYPTGNYPAQSYPASVQYTAAPYTAAPNPQPPQVATINQA